MPTPKTIACEKKNKAVIDKMVELLMDDRAHDQFLPLLEKYPQSIDWTFGDDKTFLMVAAGNGRLDAVKALIDKGSDIEARSHCQWTPLMHASGAVTEYLLDKGANIDAVCDVKESALDAALNKGDEFTALILLRRNAKADTVDVFDGTPFDSAIHQNCFTAAKLIAARAPKAHLEKGRETAEGKYRTPFSPEQQGVFDAIDQALAVFAQQEQAQKIKAIENDVSKGLQIPIKPPQKIKLKRNF